MLSSRQNPTTYTLHPTPYTLHATSYNPRPTRSRYTLRRRQAATTNALFDKDNKYMIVKCKRNPGAIKEYLVSRLERPAPYALNPTPCTLRPERYTLTPRSSAT